MGGPPRCACARFFRCIPHMLNQQSLRKLAYAVLQSTKNATIGQYCPSTRLQLSKCTRKGKLAKRYPGPILQGSVGACNQTKARSFGSSLLRLGLGLAHRIAESAGLDISTAAVQFPLRDPMVVSAVLGSTQPSHIAAGVSGQNDEIPETIWGQFTSAALS